jgi:hypothetical protein
METFNVNLSKKFLSLFFGWIMITGFTLILLYIMHLFIDDKIVEIALVVFQGICSITITFPLSMMGAIGLLYVMNKITINNKYFNSELF